MTDGEGSADGGNSAAADGAAEGAAPTTADPSGVSAWRRPPPEVTVSVTPSPVTASTPAAVVTADRKLSSSLRAYIASLSRSAQPVASIMTKQDTDPQRPGWEATDRKRR